MLEREEYIEQAHFFSAIAERQQTGLSTQELLVRGARRDSVDDQTADGDRLS